ncbi:hypothetical protein C8J56DRAFT_899303 [Mycena floridula]|nr:hypothetical protein C8J56DRAFT_899303 [Mycena floridula]
MASIPHSPEDQQFLDDIPSHHILAFRNYANPALFLDNNWICITRLRYFLLDVMPEASTTSQQPPKRVEASSSSASSAPNIKVERVDHSLPKIKREPVTSDLPLAPSISEKESKRGKAEEKQPASMLIETRLSPPNKTVSPLIVDSTEAATSPRAPPTPAPSNVIASSGSGSDDLDYGPEYYDNQIPMANPFLEAQDHKYAGFGTGLNDFGFDFTSQVASGSSVAFDFESFDYDALLGDDMDSFIPRSSPTPSGWPTLPAAPPSTPPRASPAVLMDIAANAGELTATVYLLLLLLPKPPPIPRYKTPAEEVFGAEKRDEGNRRTGIGGTSNTLSNGFAPTLTLPIDTSSKSAKLVHGGVRYLQTAVRNWEQWKLVRETLSERATFLHVVPYLSGMLPIMLPVYKAFVPGKERQVQGERERESMPELDERHRLNPSSLHSFFLLAHSFTFLFLLTHFVHLDITKCHTTLRSARCSTMFSRGRRGGAGVGFVGEASAALVIRSIHLGGLAWMV